MIQLDNKCVFSIDVEDWFHILDVPSTPKLADWEKLPSRVERNFMRLLDIADEYNVRMTCFFLGWIAQRFPQLVRTALNRGHEIASHGWAHRLAYQLTPREFYEDAVRAKVTLEQIAGVRVLGYRCAGFSLTPGSSWVFDELLRAGYSYDASLFPMHRAEGGWKHGELSPHILSRPEGTLVEFPVTVSKILGRSLCFFGGGYLRLFPINTILRMTDRVLSDGRPVVFYVHPREIDPEQPRLHMNLRRQFRSYVNLRTTEHKIRRILMSYEFDTIARLLADHFKFSNAQSYIDHTRIKKHHSRLPRYGRASGL